MQSTAVNNTRPWTAHGALEVSADGHFLQHSDGTAFFWLGDTAWRLPVLSPNDVEYYLANRVQKGFNVIQLNDHRLKAGGLDCD